ncbi:MAG TPA: hypothetical protein VNW73_09305 [Ktedonobacteraceae bacterium]|nr:hypothetical protein [Ktedonobacteraceae bacterium]
MPIYRAHRRFIGHWWVFTIAPPPFIIPHLSPLPLVILSAAKDLPRHAVLPPHASTCPTNLLLLYEAHQPQSVQSASPSILEGG